MLIEKKYVQDVFDNLRIGENKKFFDYVTDDVVWTVMGTHPLAGTYKSKEEFITHTFQRLNNILKEGVILKVTHIIVEEDTAAIEMKSISTALNGIPFNNTYCWIVKFEKGLIVEVRAYLDSALVKKIIDENE
jgi:uncharacterized protein